MSTTTSHNLDALFEALGNEHRRQIFYALSLEPHTISQLAIMRGLSLPAIHKHIKALESAGLIVRKKTGRTNFLTLNRQSIRELQQWLTQFQAYWGTDQESLANYADQLKGSNPERG